MRRIELDTDEQAGLEADRSFRYREALGGLYVIAQRGESWSRIR